MRTDSEPVSPQAVSQLRIDVRNHPGETGRLPLVLLPGIGASLDLYEDFRAALPGRPSVGLDPPGVGGSPLGRYPSTMSGYADACVEALDQAGIEHFDLLGLSWGGALAQELTLRHPQRVRRLVLVATMFGIGALPGDPVAMSILATPWRYYSPTYLRMVAPLLYGGAIRSDPGLLDRQAYLRHRNAPDPMAYCAQLQAVMMWSSGLRLRHLHQSTLIMAANDDPIINTGNAHIMQRLLPNARLEIVQGGGHLFLMTAPQQTAASVTQFLDEP
ncbi:MAG: alpha/beta fold hydrolase [Acidimicrobiales bacterium]